MAFTRNRFAQVCQKIISARNDDDDDSQNEFLARGSRGWKWVNHSTVHSVPDTWNCGYLERIGYTSWLSKQHTIQQQCDALAEDGLSSVVEHEDQSVATVPDEPQRPSLTVQQNIAYSPTFQIPVFYFLIYSQDGAVLPLSDIMQTTFFSRDALPLNAEVTSYSISFRNSNFPVLSLGDHPVLNEPYWYLHPCQSSAAVDELMQAIPQPDGDNEDHLLLWLKAWFLVLQSIVDIR